MRRSVLKRKKTQNDGGAAGMLVLLLMVLVIFCLKEGLSSPDVGAALCDDSLYAQIQGDISCPGVYSFCGKITLGDLIEKGGGFAKHDYPCSASDNSFIESGAKVTIDMDNDECVINIEEISAFYKVTLGIPISINIESEEGLTAISGIGPALAREIIRERDKKGGFTDLGEIKDIYGIGNRLYERILPYVQL
jgi:competence ComEA-like helix-hairpin-helix protein